MAHCCRARHQHCSLLLVQSYHGRRAGLSMVPENFSLLFLHFVPAGAIWFPPGLDISYDAASCHEMVR